MKNKNKNARAPLTTSATNKKASPLTDVALHLHVGKGTNAFIVAAEQGRAKTPAEVAGIHAIDRGVAGNTGENKKS